MSKLERKIKKDMKQNMLGTKPSDDLYERVKEELNLNKNEKKPIGNTSFKKWIPIFATSFCIILAIVISIVAFNGRKIEAKEYNAIVQVDVNPSIQMVVDEKNQVLSVIGLNDEGKMVIYDEQIVGKNLDEALELIIKIETDLGYFVKEGNDNQVTITISAKTDDRIDQLQIFSQNALNHIFDEMGLVATIEKAKGYKEAELKKLAKELDPTLTDEQMDNFDYNDYINVVKLYHLEVADFVSVKLEEMYKEFKQYQIFLTEKEEIKRAVDNLNIFYQALVGAYDLAYEALNHAYTNMQDGYYAQFIDPKSNYQIALVELADLKQAYLNQRLVVANLTEEATDEEIFHETQKLLALKLEYETKFVILENIEKASSNVYEALVLVFESSLGTMKAIEEKLPDEIKTITFEAIVNTEKKLNEFKEAICSSFEDKYLEAIEKAKADLANRKKALKESLHNRN